ncbi:MAG: serine/threonine-protein kinase [Verrucomicrobiota bacterium]|nr:serine/threonine-protein kinase [Verrucomicrobiota bacterium]
MGAPPISIPGVRFEHLIGTGGMSEVWLCFHGGLNKEVAIKVMFKDAAASGEDVRQFMLESRVMEQISHPGIVHSYEADCRDGRYYFVMDYVDGYTLALFLARKERLPEPDALLVLDSVADALGYAWREHHVIHCDIKPDNLMVNGDGIVKIMDMGLCHVMGGGDRAGLRKKPDASPKDTIVGTPAYMSPEQIYGDSDLDCRSDIYNMGATLYQLVTGQVLFPGLSNDDTLRAHVSQGESAPDPRTMDKSISPGLVRLLSKMCAKDRSARYGSWEDVLADSRIVQSGGLPTPLPQGCDSSVAEMPVPDTSGKTRQMPDIPV